MDDQSFLRVGELLSNLEGISFQKKLGEEVRVEYSEQSKNFF